MPRGSRLHGQITLSDALRGAACGLLLLLSACAGGPRLAASPQTSVRLSGQWVLDVAASDDAPALIKAALPKPRPQRKARYDLWGNELREGEDPGQLPPGTERGDARRVGRDSRSGGADYSGFDGPSHAPPPIWGRMPAYEFVSFFAAPPQRLEVREEGGLVRLGAGSRLRAYTPGDQEPTNVTDRYGSRAIRGGWLSDAFVVFSTDGKNIQVQDAYRRLKDDRLERVSEIHITGVKSLTVRSQYRRATPAELVVGTEEGPPSPVR